MVSAVTLRQWAQKGLLRSVTTAGGHRRFLPDEIERFALERGGNSAAAVQPRRLLIADDDRTYREILGSTIRAAKPDAELHFAADGFEAGMITHTARPDVFLLDVNMPGLSGLDVCRRLRSNPDTQRARIVVMSGLLTPELADECRTAGADAWCEKSADCADVIKALAL